MFSFKVGACGSPAAGGAMVEYYLAGTLKPDTIRAAAYYSAAEVREERANNFWQETIQRGRLGADGTVAELRRDISATMADRLGIANVRKPLTQDEIANLLNARQIDGRLIEGRKKHSATRSVAEVFGLDPQQPPTAEVIRNVLAGKCADGKAPQSVSGKALSEKEIKGAQKRFKDALGIPKHREPTAEELAHLENGKLATGRFIDQAKYRRQIHATRPAIGFIDMTFSADKSLSVAWALARAARERDALLDIHKRAVAATMTHVEARLGFARKGKGGKDGVEPGELAWISFDHFTARPTVDIERHDKEGRAYTETREVPSQTADPQLHTHVTVLNSVLTESGRIGAIDGDRLKGLVKEFGAVYQANVATYARKHGIETVLDERTGAARFTTIPDTVRALFSKRHKEAEHAAREFAQSKGVDWNAATGEQKVALLKAGAAETRQVKEGTKTDFAVWHEQAEAAAYRHKTVWYTAKLREPLPDEERHEAAYRTALPMLEDRFKSNAVLDAQELREIAARALIATGIGDAGEDIEAVVGMFRERGVMQDGEQVKLMWGAGMAERGKERETVTTSLHVAEETELIRLAKTAASDKSAALTPEQIDHAAAMFLARNPAIDPDSEQWQVQRRMVTELATSGRLGVGIGVAGAGKTTLLAPMVDAWKADGRQVYGTALAWRQASALRAAGIEEGAAVAAFLKRVETGRYQLDRNSVVAVDEVSQIGTHQMLDLLRIREQTGAQMIMIGDPLQANAIEGGPGLELLREALGEEAIPEILTTVRQRTEREREIAGLFRAGRAAEALEMKQADSSAMLVAGGREATVRRVAQLWHERTEANRDDPDFRLTVSAPTNADCREIGAAIRDELRRADKLGADVAVLEATDRTGEVYKLPLAVGDKVRVFDRLYNPRTNGRRSVLASNGDVVEVRAIGAEGMLVRNTAGAEGVIAWKKIQSGPGEPLRLAYGYATTVDVAPKAARRQSTSMRFYRARRPLTGSRRMWRVHGTNAPTGSSSMRPQNGASWSAARCSGSGPTSPSTTSGKISARTFRGSRSKPAHWRHCNSNRGKDQGSADNTRCRAG